MRTFIDTRIEAPSLGMPSRVQATLDVRLSSEDAILLAPLLPKNDCMAPSFRQSGRLFADVCENLENAFVTEGVIAKRMARNLLGNAKPSET